VQRVSRLDAPKEDVRVDELTSGDRPTRT
jgi:hypothetical protein